MARIALDFEYEGHVGRVTAVCEPSDDPVRIGKDETDRDFPVCDAAIDLPTAAGYLRFCGWVQLVRSSDNTSDGEEFEPDPLGPFADSPSPFCFFGSLPTLFDAPSRSRERPMEWEAHSFLSVLAMDGEMRAVRPLVGFRWGFDIDAGGAVRLRELAPLRAAAWEGHRPLLARWYPTWSFLPGTF